MKGRGIQARVPPRASRPPTIITATKGTKQQINNGSPSFTSFRPSNPRGNSTNTYNKSKANLSLQSSSYSSPIFSSSSLPFRCSYRPVSFIRLHSPRLQKSFFARYSSPNPPPQPPKRSNQSQQQQYQQQMQQQQQQMQQQQQQQRQRQQQPEQTTQTTSSAQSSTNTGPIVFTITTQNFETEVHGSKTPVIVDCWADWCEPCKTLTPKLEEAARKYGVRLGKLNVDENPAIVQALRVEQLPTVFLVQDRKVLNYFIGVPSDEELAQFFQQASQAVGTTNAQPLLERAASLLNEGKIFEASSLYNEIYGNSALGAEAAALSGLVRCALAEKNIDAAEEMIATLKKEHASDMHQDFVKQAISALELAKSGSTATSGSVEELLKKLEQDPNDLQSRFDLSAHYFNSGSHEKAIDEAIKIIRKDKTWNNDAARLFLLKIFEVLGPKDPITAKGRKKLAAVLF